VAVGLGLLLGGLCFPKESGAETSFCSPASYNLFPLTSLQERSPVSLDTRAHSCSALLICWSEAFLAGEQTGSSTGLGAAGQDNGVPGHNVGTSVLILFVIA